MAARKKSSSRPPQALRTYRAKRDFSKTSEPSGARGRKAKTGFAYLIQKHAASRLHYDFRLEMDGTLKSWAVTRGPSLDPADKRLAVHVEDHPLDYGDFEGTIPQGQYGGGTVMLWDTGTWEPIGDAREGYRKGRLTFLLHGKRLKGEWHLVRMTGRAAQHGKHENWLLIKAHDDEAKPGHGDELLERYTRSAVSNRSMDQIAKDGGQPIKTEKKAPRKPPPKPKDTARKKSPRGGKLKPPPDFIAPELATLVKQPPTGKNWVHEIKFDGYRALCRIDGDDIKLLTRANNDWTRKLHGLADELKSLPVSNAIIDGEVVMLKPDGTMSFSALQQALGKDQQGKLHYYAFDLLYLDGEDLTSKPLLERKKALLKIWPRDHPQLHYSEHFTENGTQVLEHACRIALEGIVSKRADAPYRGGRGGSWVKTKCVNEQETVIGGYTLQPKHPGILGALLVGYYEKDNLIFAGKVGTGFSHEEGRQLLAKFKPLQRKASPFKNTPRERSAVWLDPKLVAQVFFAEWTEGGAMRHPSFHGLREDKPATQVVREKPADAPPANKEAPRMTKASPKSSVTKASPKSAKGETQIAGVTLTHPDRVIYADQNITKRELAEYYDAVAPYMLPYVAGRPISLLRCPGGSGKSCFFQRHIDEGLPPHVKTIPITINEKRNYLTIRDKAGLIELVQMGVLEIHIWGAHAETIDKPDRMVFDFDPAEDVSWAKVKQAARDMRDYLKSVGLESFLEATGGKGLHVVVPLVPAAGWDEVKGFSRAVAEAMMHLAPDAYTINSRKDGRHGRIFIDYLRNTKGASAIAPYSTRAREGAPVAVPLAWEELKTLPSSHAFNERNILARLRKLKKDPWEGMAKLRQRLPAKLLKAA